MRITATEFKARCLELMDEVAQTRKPILITKRGRIVAQLSPAPPSESKPWLTLRGSASYVGDLLSPTVNEKEIESLR